MDYVDGKPLSIELIIAFLVGLLGGPLVVSVFDQIFMHIGMKQIQKKKNINQ